MTLKLIKINKKFITNVFKIKIDIDNIYNYLNYKKIHFKITHQNSCTLLTFYKLFNIYKVIVLYPQPCELFFLTFNSS